VITDDEEWRRHNERFSATTGRRYRGAHERVAKGIWSAYGASWALSRRMPASIASAFMTYATASPARL
jgi:hypothetical protein